MSRLLVLSAKDVNHLIQRCLSIQEILSNQARVFQVLHNRSSTTDNTLPLDEASFESPHRTTLSLKKATTLFMPARLGEEVACKVVGVPKLSSGLSAATMVLDAADGSIKALVNATSLTALRTAAGSALATLALHGKKQSKHITIFGSGQQALHHACLFSSIHSSQISPRLDFVVRSSLPDSVTKGLLQADVRPKDIHTILSEDREKVEESLSKADIVICCTPSQSPLFSSKWVQSGTHIVLVGSYKPTMQEVEVELVHRAEGRIIVDDQDACSAEAGDLIKAGVDAKQCVSLGSLLSDEALKDLALGRIDTLPTSEQLYSIFDRLNRSQTGDITLFKSVGVGLQDVAMTSLIVQKAIEQGLGADIDF